MKITSGVQIGYIKKRNGETQKFEVEKIVTAIHKAMLSVDHGRIEDAHNMALNVVNNIQTKFEEKKQENLEYLPSVEEIQDIVEEILMVSQFHDVAKSYILYRQERADQRRRDIFKKRTDGSVQHLKELSEQEKMVFRTFSEIDQKVVIEQAAERQKYIDQGQSLNLMIDPEISTKDVNALYIHAWKLGIKTLYYQHSMNAAQQFGRKKMQENKKQDTVTHTSENVCTSCEA